MTAGYSSMTNLSTGPNSELEPAADYIPEVELSTGRRFTVGMDWSVAGMGPWWARGNLPPPHPVKE